MERKSRSHKRHEGSAQRQISWEQEVDKMLSEYEAERTRYSDETDEYIKALLAQGKAAFMLGGRSGHEVTMPQIKTYFEARLLLAQLDMQRGAPAIREKLQDRYFRATFTPEVYQRHKPHPARDELEIFQQAVHLELPIGKKAAINWLKKDQRALIEGISTTQAIVKITGGSERDKWELGIATRRSTAHASAIKLLEGKTKK